MLDIKFIRENHEIIRKDLVKRKDTEKLPWVDELLEKDKEYRKLLAEAQGLRHRRNEITGEINALKKEGKDVRRKLEEAKNIPQRIKEIEELVEGLKEKIHFYQMRLPNILHETVPYGKDDTENVVVRRWGKPREPGFELKPHGEIIKDLGVADFKRAAKIAGAGFYYLTGDLALLDQALMQFAIRHLTQIGYSLVEPPFMMSRKAYEGVTDLADFENVMYKIQDEDLYLIATSEHPMAAMFMDEVIDAKDLPIRFAGISACFRKEIGSRGVDTKGLFRVHQFNKIEQFVFCKPEDSWMIHEEMIENAEGIFQALELPYRIVNICTGDIGIVAAKKYDMEAWMPREKEYKEVVSCSNCTAYQAVRLNIKYQEGENREYLHTLNSTAIATSRALRAIIENYQEKDGSIRIPKALVPFMHGITSIEPKK